MRPKNERSAEYAIDIRGGGFVINGKTQELPTRIGALSAALETPRRSLLGRNRNST